MAAIALNGPKSWGRRKIIGIVIILTETYIKIKDISKGIHHVQRAPERQKLDYINKHWLKYTSGEINRFHFIKIMGYYNKPSIDL